MYTGHNVGERLSWVIATGPLRHVTDNVEEIPADIECLSAARQFYRSLFRDTGIIRWIDVSDRPRPDAMELNNGITFGPGEMLHASGPVAKRASGHCLSRGFIEFITHAKVEDAADDGDVLDGRVDVRRNRKAIGQHDAHGEGAFFGGIAFEHGHFGSRRQGGRAVFPFDLVRSMDLLAVSGRGAAGWVVLRGYGGDEREDADYDY